MSRYVERAISMGRLVEVTWHLELDAGDLDQPSVQLWAPLLRFGAAEDEAFPVGRTSRPRDVRHFLAFDTTNPNSLISCIRSARAAAQGVRESISSEMWEQLNLLYLSLVDPRLAVEAEQDPHVFYRRVREGAQFFHGLADCTLAHDEAWRFLELGRYLERGDNVARLVDLQAHLLAPAGAHADEAGRWLAVLRSCGAAEAYARYYSMRVEPARVMEFLLLNPVFPQSLRFCMTTAWDDLQAIARLRTVGADSWVPAVRAMGKLQARLEHVAIDEVLEEGIRPYLHEIEGRIGQVCNLLTAQSLREEPQLGRLVGVARAAMIMAAQQQ